MERSHSSALSVARASHDQETWSTIRESLKETTIEVRQMWQGAFPHQVKIHEGNHSGEKSFICTKCGKRFSRSRDFQYHQRKEKDIKVSGAFPHHNSKKEWHWRKAIQVHEVWQELLMIKRLEEMIRGSMKETTNEVPQMWRELFHIRWRFMKGITLERSHSIAQSVARASQDPNT